MKKSFLIVQTGLLVILILGIFMILRQKMIDKENAISNTEALQIAGLQEMDEDLVDPMDIPESEPEEVKSFFSKEPLPDEAMHLEDIKLDALRKVNDEVIGWIEIPETEISYPVLQCEDNEYYLSRDWKKENNSAGAIFLECKSDPELIRFHTIVYGHRMRSGAMFGSLKYYQNLEYWQEHPYVYLVIDSGIYRYDIFAAWEAEVEDMVYQLNLAGQEKDFIRLCLEKSVIDTGIVPGTKNRILTMSTCTGNGHAKRWVVQGYMTKAYPRMESKEGTD